MSHSLNAQLEIYGPRNWFEMWTMSTMAVILGMQGTYLDAEELAERALLLRTRKMDSSHPFRYVSKLYLAWLYNETGRLVNGQTTDMKC
jgi:hypothetical protein